MLECLEISDICNEVFLATQLQAAWLFGKVEVFDENIWRVFFVEDRRVPAVFGTCDSPPPPPVKFPCSQHTGSLNLRQIYQSLIFIPYNDYTFQ